ncbi:response regulator transcription factor [bacterium]|nr:response regulator transcription factor [bacterium]
MKLTKRELEICKYLIQGKNNSEIGKLLYLSEHTVKFHVSSIIARLGASNRTEVAYILGKENIINL